MQNGRGANRVVTFKDRPEVLIAAPGKTRRRCLVISNTLDDFQRLIAILGDYTVPGHIGFEAASTHHRALIYQLGVAGLDVKLVSSVALARTREALYNSGDKNDPKDAQVMLHMLQTGATQVFLDPLRAGTADIQEPSITQKIVSRAKSELRHRMLGHSLPFSFPEAPRFQRSSRSGWFLAFLEMFPSAPMITAMDKEDFTAAAWRVIREGLSVNAFNPLS
jgi:hypothetical protein